MAPRSRARRVVLAVALLALFTGGIGVYAGRTVLIELWQIPRLRSDDSGEAASAARALARVGSIRSVDPLLDAFLASSGDEFRTACVTALAAIGDSALERFRVRLQGRSAEVRLGVATQLAGLGKADCAAQLFRDLATEPAVAIRAAVARQVGATGPRSLDVLLVLLAAKEGEVRRAAVEGLERVGGAASAALERRLLDRSELLRVRAGALDVLARRAAQDPRALTALERVLTDPEGRLRGASLRALDGLGLLPPGPHVRLRFSSVSGAPGDKVYLSVRGDLERYAQVLQVRFETPDSDVFQVIETQLAGELAKQAPPRSAVHFPKPRGGGVIAGVFLQGEGVEPMPPRRDQELFRLGIRLRPHAVAGEYPLRVREVSATGDAGNPLDAVVETEGMLVVTTPPLTFVVQQSSAGAEGEPTAVSDASEPLTERRVATGFSMRAEAVRCDPGAKNVEIRVYASSSVASQGYSVGLRIDPELVRLKKLSLAGTATEEAKHDQFLYQKHVLDTGETSAGIIFDMTGARGHRLPAGVDQHVLTIVVDVAEGAPDGTVVPVQLGSFGDPPQRCVFAVTTKERGTVSRQATTTNGAIRIGSSP